MFVVIDWLDGSWKGTQVKLVAQKLEKLWKKVKILDYPRYWEKSAFFVEKYLNWWYWIDLTAKQASIFYALDRFDDSYNLREEIKTYDFIISNRYVSANMIHQTWKIFYKEKRQEFLDWLEELEFEIMWIPRPDKVIFLNVTPEISQELVLKKETRRYLKWDKKMDLHEEDKNHLNNAYISANEIAKKYNWIKIDCENSWKMRTIEDINQEIFKNII